MSPPLTGRFLTTGPPGKSCKLYYGREQDAHWPKAELWRCVDSIDKQKQADSDGSYSLV